MQGCRVPDWADAAALRQVVEATLARKLTEHVERIDTDMARTPWGRSA